MMQLEVKVMVVRKLSGDAVEDGCSDESLVRDFTEQLACRILRLVAQSSNVCYDMSECCSR